MAKREGLGVSSEGKDTAVETTTTTNSNKMIRELKKELQRLTKEIIDEEQEEEDNDEERRDSGVEIVVGKIDKAIQALAALKELKISSSTNNSSSKKKRMINNNNNNNNNNNSFSSKLDDDVENDVNVPGEFLCPISRELMRDPVVLSTGQTYDRPYIHKWLKEGNRTCPQTQQVLSHVVLTPNQLVQDLIAQWCKKHGIDLPPPVQDADDGVITNADRSYLNSLLEKMSSTLSDQKQAAKEIRLLTKRMPSFRSFFGESNDAIPQLLSPLTKLVELNEHPDLQEDLVTAILNLSIHDNNKKLIAEHPLVIPMLVESLSCGSIETRSNAAAALFTLSALDSNKYIIGQLDAMKPLIDLLAEGHPMATKDAASAIFNLCFLVDNGRKAVRCGAVGVILRKIKEKIYVDELMTILALLSKHQGALEELRKPGGVDILLGVLRESTSERNKENCIAILEMVCLNNRHKLNEVREEEMRNKTISKVLEHGTARAQRKAKIILDRVKKGVNYTHTA